MPCTANDSAQKAGSNMEWYVLWQSVTDAHQRLSPSLRKRPPRIPASEGHMGPGGGPQNDRMECPPCELPFALWVVCCSISNIPHCFGCQLGPRTRRRRHAPKGKLCCVGLVTFGVPRLTRRVDSLLTGWVSRARPRIRTPHLRERSATRSCPSAVQT